MWSTPNVIIEGTDMEEVIDEMRVRLLQQYEMTFNTMEVKSLCVAVSKRDKKMEQ